MIYYELSEYLNNHYGGKEMRLSEALIQRADLQKRIQQLHHRLKRSARIQEDEQVPEEPQELFTELDQLISQFSVIAAQVNLTNSQTSYDETRMLTDSLAERDAILLHRKILESVIHSATGDDDRRYRYTQIKSFSAINIRDVQASIDTLSQRYRLLDTRIQEINWTTELIE